MRKSSTVTMCILSLILLLTGCILSLSPSADVTARHEHQLTNIVTLTTPSFDATRQYEQTLIVRLTEEPDLASSLTPFYAYILRNEALSYLTITPTLNPIATQACFLYADFYYLDTLEETIVDTLAGSAINADASVVNGTIWHVEDCDSTAMPTENIINIWLEQPNVPENLNEILYDILAPMIETEEGITEDASRIRIIVRSDSSEIIFDTTWLEFQMQYNVD